MALNDLISVTRYFARQLLNKHAINYQNVEKNTKFLLSTEVIWKSIRHLIKTKSVKCFSSLKLCFFHVFLSYLYFLTACNCTKWKYAVPLVGSTDLIVNQAALQVRPVPEPAISTGQWWSARFRRFSWIAWAGQGPATVLIEFWNNMLCYGVFGWISSDNQNITNYKRNY
jgi:hypothetical protein